MVSIDEIMAAASRIEGSAVRTPILTAPELNDKTGARIFLKPEIFQIAGSFKFRGAYNRLSQLDEDQRRAGVVAWSSGNHAQGVAAAASMLDVESIIVMPADAPKVKSDRTRELGAQIVPYDRNTESREEIAFNLAQDRGSVVVPSFDDPDIIAGQGTVGVEIVEQLTSRDTRLDLLLVPCGGGGLIAGTSIAVHDRWPDAEIYSVEPENYDDTKLSLNAGIMVQNKPGGSGFCDALLAPTPGEITFPINQKHLKGGLTVTDEEVRNAIRYAFQRLKLVVEPGGAVALAALLAGKIDIRSRRIGIVLSGANIDPAVASEIWSG